jgi:hypothetical protein
MKKVKKLVSPPKDIRVAAVDMSQKEAQYLLEDFYRLKAFQQSTREHDRLLIKTNTSHDCVAFTRKNCRNLRDGIRLQLDIWSENYPEAKWAKKIRGIGPIIAAGLAVYIDFNKAKNHYSIWAWAGQTPTSRPPLSKKVHALIDESVELFGDIPTDKHVEWIADKLGKNYETWRKFCTHNIHGYSWWRIHRAMTYPEYSLGLKQTCIDIGNQVIRYDNLYQGVYRLQLVKQHENNEAGKYAKAAARQLQTFEYKEDRPSYEIYSSGKLPAAHLKNKAKRQAVKLFLAHYYQIGYYIRHGEFPPAVHGVGLLTGSKKIIPPNLDFLRMLRSGKVC